MRVPSSVRVPSFFLAQLCLLAALTAAPAAETPYIWIEGEQPTSENVKTQTNNMGRPDWLSGASWLQYSVDGANVTKDVPADGALLSYAFKADQPGQYEVWARLGFETVKTPFEWHVDGGEWQKAVQHLTDLVELQFFSEIGWQRLGTQTLTPGEHQLEFRIPRSLDKNGAGQRMIFALDAVCLSAGKFYPHGKFKPGEDGQDDKDRAAAKNVFRAPAPEEGGKQTGFALKGDWEVCRDDEDDPQVADQPLAGLPEKPFWTAIPVPSDKNTSRPELQFAHRLWFRTRVSVPAAAQGHSFFLVFPQNSMNSTVLVNGSPCGFIREPLARAQMDVTKAVRPGAVNEILVGIRDSYYAFTPATRREHFPLPTGAFSYGFLPMDYPMSSHFEAGMLLAPEFVTAAGPAYVSDVFCQPSVARKALELEVTATAPSAPPGNAELVCEALDPSSGQVEKKWDAQPWPVASAETVGKFSLPWADPKLWWPDSPRMYVLRTTLKVGGKTVDVKETPFGFREWTMDGILLKLNGVPYHAWADTHGGNTKEEWLDFHHKSHETMLRLWGVAGWEGMNVYDALDWFDQHGVVLRHTGITDGEAMNYAGFTEAFKTNYREQVYQWVKGERNHPSIFCWSIENEITYINAMNAGLGDQWEPVTAQVAKDLLGGIDPTRAIMTDGGGAGKAQGMPINGDHYVADDWPKYPDLAYQPNVLGGGRGRWWWDMKRPRIIGEDYFYEGNHPELSYFGGETAFTGKAGTLHASALAERILQEGYRWANYAGWHFWINPSSGDGSQYNSFSERAVFCRQWDWTFGSGQQARRAFAIFNDTEHPDPLTFTWTLTVGGKPVATRTSEHQVAPGTHEIFDADLPMPVVNERQEGELTLDLSAGGQKVFTDKKAVSILPVKKGPVLTKFSEGDLAVYDPKGAAAAFLKQEGVSFTELPNLDTLPARAKVLLVGQDAIGPALATDTRFAAYALDGHRVVVLEQSHPLKYQAVPAEMGTTVSEGRTGFIEDGNHPAFAGLADKDFFTWATGALTAAELSKVPPLPEGDPNTAKATFKPYDTTDDEIVYRNAYVKPTSGGRSLLECDTLLHDSGLVEVPVGDGLMLLSQLTLEEKIGVNATARTLLNNLLDYAAAYRLEFNDTVAATDDLAPLSRALDASGLKYSKSADPLAAISGREKVAVVSATPAHLKILAGHLDAVQKFTAAGGYLVLNGLTPEGLADYNKLVGYDHIIRPFHRERLLFPPVRDSLTAGLTAGDVVMYSSQRIFDWQEGNYTDDGEFNYVVDLDEVAPFATSTFGNYDKIVNGFTSADGWPLIINFPATSQPYNIPIKLARPETLTEVTWVGNTLYKAVTKIALLFDGKDAQTFDVQGNQPMTFALNPPRAASEVTLQLLDWEGAKPQPDSSVTIGIDKIYLKAQRPAGFADKVKGMLNIGAMVDYPQGKGGIVLCNLAYKDSESVPGNALKKQKVLAQILHNLHAPFSGGKTIIAGAHLRYEPIDLSHQATAYRDEKGWFGDKSFTFKDLPTGDETFANVKYNVYDFPTSPVPTVVILAGNGAPAGMPAEVKGIPVNRKADALFFLQAAKLETRRTADDIKNNKQYELFDYIVHYADGKDEKVPIYAEQDVDDYKQPGAPAAIPGAAVAWSAPYAATGYQAVAYSKQWSNPRPDVTIQSIDVVSGPDKARGVPAVIAITAASAER